MLSIQTDYSTLTAVLGRRAHSHREALSSAAFVADQVLRSCSSYGEDSLDALQYMHGEWWSPCIYRRNQNDSSPLELQLRRTLRRHSECASAQKAGTLAASYLWLCAVPWGLISWIPADFRKEAAVYSGFAATLYT